MVKTLPLPRLSAQARIALQLLGNMITIERKERLMSQANLGERLGVSRYTVMALEKGDPKVASGTLFEAAAIVGIPLLADNPQALAQLATSITQITRLLPQRVGHKKEVLPSDDF